MERIKIYLLSLLLKGTKLLLLWCRLELADLAERLLLLELKGLLLLLLKLSLDHQQVSK